MATIAIHGLCKSYGKTEVLRDIDLTFEEGRIYGLLGRNGVGKSTLLNLITRRIFPDRGEIAVDGVPVGGPGDPLRKIYCMSEAALYPENMRVAELYRWTADFYPHFDRARADRLTAAFGLDPKKRIKSLSTGYASIVKLIVTLSSGAEVLIFDEPVLGLDAGHRSLFYKEVLSLYGEKGCTVVLSTHIIEEISDLLESVIILEDCRVLASESVDGLLERYHCVSGAEGEVLVPANFNCPGQIVIAGAPAAVESAEAAWAEAGKRSSRLATSGAFHSPLMADAAAGLAAYLENVEFSEARIPLVCNVTAAPLSAADARENLVRHLTSPVRFDASVAALTAAGADMFVEVGFGGVLANLVKRIDKTATRACVQDRASFDGCLAVASATDSE